MMFGWRFQSWSMLIPRLSLTGSLDLAPKYPMDAARRYCGLDWPTERGFTMVGLVRLSLGHGIIMGSLKWDSYAKH